MSEGDRAAAEADLRRRDREEGITVYPLKPVVLGRSDVLVLL